jgi:cell division protein FtsL
MNWPKTPAPAVRAFGRQSDWEIDAMAHGPTGHGKGGWIGLATGESHRRIAPQLFLLLLLFTLLSLFHVWSRVRVIELSVEVNQLRNELCTAEQENSRLRLEGTALKTPSRIEALARGEFGMAPPTPRQLVVVK